MDLSLVIPCYNEEKNLPILITKLERILKNKKYEVLLVDNGSLDNSSKILKSYEEKYKNLKCIFLKNNQGYGGGIIEGLKNANGKHLAWTHADIQTNPCDIFKAERLIKLKNDNFFIKGLRKKRSLTDNFFTLGMSILATIKLGYFFRDINAQPTIFSAKFFKSWDNPPLDFSLDLYAYYMAKKFKYKINRFPVIFNKRLYGSSSWNKNLSSKIRFIKRNIKFINILSKSY